MKTAMIFDVVRGSFVDGPGIRTTVFFKGCPLKCVWCHNPEGIDFKPQLALYKNKCTLCGNCVKMCPVSAHIISETDHKLEREKCVACGKCEENCFYDALKLYGREMSVSELMPILLEDRDFYENSGGGVTLSGGECLMQAEFCAELLKKLKENNIHTAVDTCGFVAKEAFDKVMPYTDIFLYDLKAFDEDVHIKCTGQSNEVILENLKYLDSCGKNIEIRIPYVPEFNHDQIEKIAEFLKERKNITKVKVLPYHDYAGSKYAALNMQNTLPKILPMHNEITTAEAYVREQGLTI